MTLPSRVPGWLATLAAALLCSSGAGATAAEKPSSSKDSAAIFPGTNSKDPISIDADKLVYYDKERKAVYSGNVVVIQGETKMTCSAMTVLLDRAPAHEASQPTNSEPGPATDSGVRHLDASGPVTVVSKTQVATGDRGSYDKAEDKVWLIGHVTLSDGQNVTKGDKLTYDLKNGLATVDTNAKSGRVHGQFVPKSNSDAKSGADATKADAAKPK
ncbi:MAG TPA: LptA/OstA family protein [Roseiarcus sp.]|jgi:lipopolysaccharide export system protein LptA